MLNTGRSGLRYFARKFLQVCVGVRPTGSCKTWYIFFPPPAAGKTLNVIEQIERRSNVGRYEVRF